MIAWDTDRMTYLLTVPLQDRMTIHLPAGCTQLLGLFARCLPLPLPWLLDGTCVTDHCTDVGNRPSFQGGSGQG